MMPTILHYADLRWQAVTSQWLSEGTAYVLDMKQAVKMLVDEYTAAVRIPSVDYLIVSRRPLTNDQKIHLINRFLKERDAKHTG